MRSVTKHKLKKIKQREKDLSKVMPERRSKFRKSEKIKKELESLEETAFKMSNPVKKLMKVPVEISIENFTDMTILSADTPEEFFDRTS